MATDRSVGRLQVATALLMGIVILLVGVVGFAFVPNEGLLFGLFGVNASHNVFHVLSGLAGVIAAYYAGGRFAREYNQLMGVVYLLLFAMGLALFGTMESLLNVNTADNVLHLALGVVFAGVGFGLGRS